LLILNDLSEFVPSILVSFCVFDASSHVSTVVEFDVVAAS